MRHLRSSAPLLLLATLHGCQHGTDSAEKGTANPLFIDADQDGSPSVYDCDDSDPTVGARSLDADCDRALYSEDCDDSDPLQNLEDVDQDGVDTCSGDCDDANAQAHPAAAAAEDALCTIDADGDGYGDATLTKPYDAGTDCDDANAQAHPAAATAEDTLCTIDADGDGHGDATLTKPYDAGTDCNDSDAAEYPGAVAESETACMRDADGDGFGDEQATWPYDAGTDCNDSDATANPAATEPLLSPFENRNCDGWAGGLLSDADHAFVGEKESDFAGWSIASAGDVNGDGRDDIVIGAYKNDAVANNAGRAYLIFGREFASDLPINLADADVIFEGVYESDEAGFMVASAGDVDADGHDDIVIGAPENDDGGSNAGAVYLLFGGRLTSGERLSLDDADVIFVGENSVDYAGMRTASAGDVDADGHDDILISAPANDDGGTGAGKVYLFSGANLQAQTTRSLGGADHAFVGEAAADSAGSSIAGVGDVDADGYDDFIIGAPYNDDGGTDAGKTYLFLGANLQAQTTRSLGEADHAFVGEARSDQSGISVAGAGDVNGDGRDDIVIGAPYNDVWDSDEGKAYLLYGTDFTPGTGTDLTAADHIFLGEATDNHAGVSVCGVGDVDGDGIDDVFIGAPSNDDIEKYAGKSYLILGSQLYTETSIPLSNASHTFAGVNPYDNAGLRVTGVGDVNGDGRDDIAVAAPYHDGGGTDAGVVYLLLSHL